MPKIRGSRFSGLVDNDDGSTISPPTKHKRAARLTTARLENLTDDERKQEVAKIKRDIQALKGNKEETRDAAAAESKEKRAREEVEKEERQDEAKKKRPERGERDRAWAGLGNGQTRCQAMNTQ